MGRAELYFVHRPVILSINPLELSSFSTHKIQYKDRNSVLKESNLRPRSNE